MQKPDPSSEFQDDPSRLYEWLCFADDAFEASDPRLNLVDIFDQVLRISMEHTSPEIRCEACRILQKGLTNHSGSHMNLHPFAMRLTQIDTEELLLGINIVGLSGDPSLADYLNPFLRHYDPSVRAEAMEAKSELQFPKRT